MHDLNILNRASFEETTLQFSSSIKSGQIGKINSGLKSGQVFCLQEISWRYGVDNAQDNYGWPKSPLKVSMLDVFIDRVETPYKAAPPKLLTDEICLEASNPSSISVQIYYTVKGILVTPCVGENLTLKEILGYVLLDNNQKGLLALSEATTDKQNLLMDSIITTLNGKLAEMPLLQKSAPALPDENTLLSLMIGDLVMYQAVQSKFNLDINLIQELAKYLMTKKWSR